MTYATNGDKFLEIMPPTLQDFDKFKEKCSFLTYSETHSEHILNFYGRVVYCRFRNLHEIHERYGIFKLMRIDLDGSLDSTYDGFTDTLNAKKQDSKRLIEEKNKEALNSSYL